MDKVILMARRQKTYNGFKAKELWTPSEYTRKFIILDYKYYKIDGEEYVEIFDDIF